MSRTNLREFDNRDRALYGLAILGAGALAVAAAELIELGPLGRPVEWLDAAIAIHVAAAIGAAFALPIAIVSLLFSSRLSEANRIRLVLAVLGGGWIGSIGVATSFAASKPLFLRMGSGLVGFYTLGAGALGVAAISLTPRSSLLQRISAPQIAAWIWLSIPGVMMLAVGLAVQRHAGAGAALLLLCFCAVAVGGLLAIARSRGTAVMISAMVLWSASGVLLWWLETGPGVVAHPQRAQGSLIMIVLDTMRADATDLYGASDQTPVLSEIARSSATFDEFVSEAPWTVPSHATMFTGLSPHEHGCWWGDRRWLHDDFETVAERLADAGHETFAIAANGYLGLTNNLQGFQTKPETKGPYEGLVLNRLMRWTGIGLERWIDKGSAEAVPLLNDWFAKRDPDQPYFLFINLLEVHTPYAAPVSDRRPPDSTRWRDLLHAYRVYHDRKWHVRRRSVGTEEDMVRELYAAEVRYQDRSLGRILETIERHQALDDVALVITSDHGENLGDGGRWGHALELNEALIRVPLLIRAPDRMEAGERIAGAFSSVDLAPTLLELAGQPGEMGKGISLLPDSRTPRQMTFAEVYPAYEQLAHMVLDVRVGLGDYRYPIRAVRDGEFKLVERGPTLRLYDIENDPTEEVDIASQRPDVVKRLSQALGVLPAASSRPARDAADPDGDDEDEDVLRDEELKARLRALGYL